MIKFVNRQIQPKDVVYMPMIMWLSWVQFQKYSDSRQHHHPGEQTMPYHFYICKYGFKKCALYKEINDV